MTSASVALGLWLAAGLRSPEEPADHLTSDPHAWVAAAIPRIWRDEDPPAGASYRMTCVIEYLDGKGRTTRRLLLEHHREARGGRMVETLVRAEEDGRDVTERQRNQEAKARHEEGRKADRWSVEETFEPPIPFLAAEPAGFRLTWRAGPEGRTQLVYEPATKRPRTARGWVELDASDGLPTSHFFAPVPLPRLVSSLRTTVGFARWNGFAVPEWSETTGEGGLLFIRRRFRVRMSWGDWRREASSPGR